MLLRRSELLSDNYFNRTVLYDNGEYSDDWTMYLSPYGQSYGGVAKKNSNNMYCKNNNAGTSYYQIGGNSCEAYAILQIPVNFTKRTTLYFTSTNSGYYTSPRLSWSLSTNKIDWNMSREGISYGTKITTSINISSYSGLYYIRLGANDGNNSYMGEMTIYKVWVV